MDHTNQKRVVVRSMKQHNRLKMSIFHVVSRGSHRSSSISALSHSSPSFAVVVFCWETKMSKDGKRMSLYAALGSILSAYALYVEHKMAHLPPDEEFTALCDIDAIGASCR
jgi:hypothetical protein